MPLGTLLLSGVLALMAGTLFRLARDLEVPALRMLGFWSLVAIGLLMARAAARQQAAEGRRSLRETLAGLGPDLVVVPAGENTHNLPPGVAGNALAGNPAYIVAPAAVLALMPDAMADYGRGSLARRRLGAGVARAKAWAGAAAAVLAGGGWEAPVIPCLVLLRRCAPEGGGDPGPGRAALVNPEGIPALVDRFRQPVRLDAGARQAVADALSAPVAAGNGSE